MFNIISHQGLTIPVELKVLPNNPVVLHHGSNVRIPWGGGGQGTGENHWPQELYSSWTQRMPTLILLAASAFPAMVFLCLFLEWPLFLWAPSFPPAPPYIPSLICLDLSACTSSLFFMNAHPPSTGPYLSQFSSYLYSSIEQGNLICPSTFLCYV